MNGLSGVDLQRQDFVDTSVFSLIESLAPGNSGVEWDIEMIESVRDLISHWLVVRKQICTSESFYPYAEDSNGSQ